MVVPMTTLNRILLEKGLREHAPFILKLDIEGSESGLFDGATNIAGLFPVIIIEPHDWMLPHAGTSQSFLRFHIDRRRDLMSRGENIFSIDYEILGQYALSASISAQRREAERNVDR